MTLFGLPDEVIAVILSSWVNVKTLTRLESALCATATRTQFLRLVGGEFFVAETVSMGVWIPGEGYSQQFKWLMKRHVRVRNWIVDEHVSMLCAQLTVSGIIGQHVRSLQLCSLTTPDVPKVYSTLLVACSGLQKLVIENCNEWETFCTLGAEAQLALQELIVVDCQSIGWKSYPRFPNLRKLHLRHLYGAEVLHSVKSLLRAAPNVTDLRLSSFVQCLVNDEILQTILSNHAAGLEIFELSIQLDDRSYAFTSAAVVALAERCSNLKTLDLTCGDAVDATAIEAFALHCGQLEGLQLWKEFTAASLAVVAALCGSRLRYLALDMTDCQPTGLLAIAKHCRTLEELHLCNCGGRVGYALVTLISSLPLLRELILNDYVKITDEMLIAIATHLPELTTLGLSSCKPGYTEAGALALVTSLTQLKRFCISGYETSVFTPALSERWQEASPGLKFFDNCLASTSYFDDMCW
jgi:hypothetical protein